MNHPVKIIYNAKLKLETALHIGCGQESPLGAFEIIRNGAGELTIPGTSIAGVFFTTLRLITTPKDFEQKIWDVLFQNEKREQKDGATPIIFRTVSLENCTVTTKIRNRVKINRETKTAEDGALFSYWEIEPEGVKFDISVEIDNLSLKNSTDTLKVLSTWVEQVLSSWHNEGVFLGGHSSSGNGFCSLKEATKSEIDSSNYQMYLNDEKIEFDELTFTNDVKQRFKTWDITVKMNEEDEGYGVNALLIKGGVSHSSLAGNTSDGVFINTGKRLFIPGSSLKGTFSMYLEKYGKGKWLSEFFGQDKADHQGYIYFPDLIFTEDMKDKTNHLVNIERHAEDEFTRAVYGSGKFNEERLFYAEVTGKIRVPVHIDAGEVLESITEGCEKRLISLGANGCYPLITIKECNNEND